MTSQSPESSLLATPDALSPRESRPEPAGPLERWLLPPRVRTALRVLGGKEPRAHRTRFYRDLVSWLLPVELQMLLLSLHYRLAGLDVSNNRRLHLKHKGRERCFVIGNGPSIRDMDLSILADEVTIGANSFYKHKDAEAVPTASTSTRTPKRSASTISASAMRLSGRMPRTPWSGIGSSSQSCRPPR